MTYKSKVVQVNVYRDGDNPIFGESVTSISIIDEAGGPFIQLKQNNEFVCTGETRLEFTEIDAIFNVTKRLVNEFENG